MLLMAGLALDGTGFLSSLSGTLPFTNRSSEEIRNNRSAEGVCNYAGKLDLGNASIEGLDFYLFLIVQQFAPGDGRMTLKASKCFCMASGDFEEFRISHSLG